MMKYQGWNISVIFFVLSTIYPSFILADYWTEREKLINGEKDCALGSKLNLTKHEALVNHILMNYKFKEYEDGFTNPNNFLAGQHFFKAKETIEASKIFELIKQIPKGASLHSHDEALASQEYVYSLTFRKNLYGCIEEGDLKFKFFAENNVSSSCNWTLISDMRMRDPNFDEFLKSKLSMICNNPETLYPDINYVWKVFQGLFRTVGGLIRYKPIFEEYFYVSLKELYDDNIKYMEFRGFLPDLYDLNGNIYTGVEVLKSYVITLNKFKENYPDFLGARFIYAPSRLIDNSTMDNYIETFKIIKRAYPDFVAGFDLVGQEDLGKPLISFVPQLLELQELGTKFFFHAGETNWNGEPTDLNLLDAILLNSTRIGHGYAILKHPVVANIVKEKQIAIEICPISNQVLKLVTDVRNHPGSVLIANNFPVVIANDDPSFWGSKGLSYDWYMAFMAMTSKETDLRFLKQLAINSIQFSSLDNSSKEYYMIQWENDWINFIEKILVKHHYKYSHFKHIKHYRRHRL